MDRIGKHRSGLARAGEEETMVKQELVQKELLDICKQHGGVLRPEEVVKRARNVNSALHPLFTWDDTKAAQEYRLWQAREIIRVSVITIPEAPGEPVRAFVSLMSDRQKEAGGYRCLINVLSNAKHRAMLLAQALNELKNWQRKYEQLTELAPIFEARERVTRRKRRAA